MKKLNYYYFLFIVFQNNEFEFVWKHKYISIQNS